MYIMLIYIYIFIYLFIVGYFIINYETLARFLQMDTKLKHKDLFKLWTQSKSKYTRIKG